MCASTMLSTGVVDWWLLFIFISGSGFSHCISFRLTDHHSFPLFFLFAVTFLVSDTGSFNSRTIIYEHPDDGLEHTVVLERVSVIYTSHVDCLACLNNALSPVTDSLTHD
jgi:hypothetical protein